MDNVVAAKMSTFGSFIFNDNIIRLLCFTIIGLGLLVTMIMLGTRGVKWIDKEKGKVRGHAFAYASSYLFVCFLFLGFIFDFIASAWVKMGEWILYGYIIIMGLYTTTNIAKTVSDFGLKKADILNKITTAMKPGGKNNG